MIHRLLRKTKRFLFASFKWMAYGRHINIEYSIAQNKVLIVKTHAIGDTIMTTPAIRALRRRYPNAKMVLLTGMRAAEIMEGNKDIDAIVSVDESILFKPYLKRLLALLLFIRRERFDMAFIFHYSYLQHLFIWLTGIGVRVGFDKDGSGFSLSHRVLWDDSGTRWTPDLQLDMARRVNAPIHDTSLVIEISNGIRRAVDALLLNFGVSEKMTLIGIFPGGGKNSRDEVNQKQWGVEKFATVIERLNEIYMARFIILGANSDKNVIEKLIKRCNVPVISMCGILSLKQLSAMIAKCDLLITNDSAPLHIATAVGTPTTSVFGPSPAIAFVDGTEKHIGIQSNYPCSPCYHNSVFKGCQDPKCMDMIPCQNIVDAAKYLLERQAFGKKA